MGAHDIIPRKFRPRGGNQTVITLEPPWSLGLDDTQFFLYDNLNETRRAHFRLDGITPGTDREFTFPDSSGTVAISGYSTQTDGITFIINGNGAPIATGVVGDLSIPYACTIVDVTALADVVGSIVVDLWNDVLVNYPPVNADSITAAAPVTISTNDHSRDVVLAGWTKTLAAGSTLRFNVDSCSSITRCTITLAVLRTIGS